MRRADLWAGAITRIAAIIAAITRIADMALLQQSPGLQQSPESNFWIASAGKIRPPRNDKPLSGIHVAYKFLLTNKEKMMLKIRTFLFARCFDACRDTHFPVCKRQNGSHFQSFHGSSQRVRGKTESIHPFRARAHRTPPIA